MTDNEIVKGLECCKYDGIETCRGCPMYNSSEFDDWEDFDCEKYLYKLALDLINRQKTEIERLQELNTIAEGVAGDISNRANNIISEFPDVIKEAAFEAVKEFVKTLKLKSDKRITTEHKIYYRYSDELLDKLLKETVGEENA